MTRYVIGPDVALRLASHRVAIPAGHQLLAPTLFRSQVLALLYGEVRSGVTTRQEAENQLDYVRALRLRFLGDRVLQRVAWRIADDLGWPDTLTAEYLALTQLQADAFITLDESLAETVTGVVRIAPIEVLGG